LKKVRDSERGNAFLHTLLFFSGAARLGVARTHTRRTTHHPTTMIIRLRSR